MSRRRRGQAWSATSVPAARRALVHTMKAEASRTATLVPRARALGMTEAAAEFETSAAEFETSAERLRDASLFWVGQDMARVAIDAARDVPALQAHTRPADTGLICFQAPLPAWDTSPGGGLALRDDAGRTDIQHDEPVPVDAVTWERISEHLQVRLCCLTTRLPLPLLGVNAPILTPFFDITMPASMPLDGTVPSIGRTGVDSRPQTTGLAALLSSTWVLMATPTTAVRKSLDGRTGKPVTTHTRPGDAVTVIDLRPMRTITDPADSSDSTGSGRRLRHRHLVRGHWTHQPYGPGRQLRRLTWIDSYIRGPQGAPLTTTETVYAWRR